jgi:PAS domain S-box-containing protein
MRDCGSIPKRIVPTTNRRALPLCMLRHKRSIAHIVIVLLVTATTFLMGVMALVGYSSYRNHQLEEFTKKNASIANQLAIGLTLPLWNFDSGEIGKVIESAMQDNDVYAVLVRSGGGGLTQYMRTRNAQWKVSATTEKLVVTALQIEKRPITVAGENIGAVEVFATPIFLEARLRRTMYSIIGLIGFVDLILVLGLYVLLWRTVLKPLKDLEQHALALSAGELAGRSVPSRRYPGELDSLRSSIEKMVGLLEARYAELQKSESSHRQLAENLRASEEKFSTAFRVSPHPIIITDLETGRIIDANEVFLLTYARTHAEAVSHTTTELGIWDNSADRDYLVEALRTHGTVRNFKTRSRSARGQPITILLSCELIRLGDRPCVLSMIDDITDQELAEAALRESEEKFSKAFRSGPDAMVITEMESGLFLEINDGFERLFGFPRAAVLGRSAVEIGVWRDPAKRQHFVELVRTQHAVRDLEVENFNVRGELVICLLSAESMVLGGKTCIVSVIHDITDRQRVAERERQAHEEFTRRLIASQEAERRRIAGELHDSLGQNLLLIKNRAQLALATVAVPPDSRWQLEGIHDLATQAITEVRQISHDLRPYQLDQLGFTRALESMIDSTARNTGFQITRKLDAVDDLFTPEAATNLYRIVQESLNNILRHSRASHGGITLERDVRHVRLEIADDGRGFHPGATPVTPRKEGGFGLRNMAERVRILGGTLVIDSAPDRGTRLEVTIPLPEEV